MLAACIALTSVTVHATLLTCAFNLHYEKWMTTTVLVFDSTRLRFQLLLWIDKANPTHSEEREGVQVLRHEWVGCWFTTVLWRLASGHSNSIERHRKRTCTPYYSTQVGSRQSTVRPELDVSPTANHAGHCAPRRSLAFGRRILQSVQASTTT
jgi:hypothetical protein